jgi:DNA-binding transcriptional MerR regulator
LRSSSGDAGPGAAAAGRPVSIGTVLHLLHAEFPEATVSTIRFLEAEGLLEPRRTPSGCRMFDDRDVERLAGILRMQRDRYLPLKVIKEHLAAQERGGPPPPSAVPASAAQPGESINGRRRGLDARPAGGGEAGRDRPTAALVGRTELLAAAEAGECELAAWEAYGLIGPAAASGSADRAGADGRSYDAEAVTVARLLADLGRFGLEPRHLRWVKAAAERQADLVEQVVAPLRGHRNPQTRARAEATARDLAELSGRLHTALLRAALGPDRTDRRGPDYPNRPGTS